MKRIPWSMQEKRKVVELFKDKIKVKQLPSMREAQEAINSNQCLKKRTAPQLRTWIHNHYKNNKPLIHFESSTESSDED